MAHTTERIGVLGMAEGQMRIADSEIIYQSSRITQMGDSVGRYSIGETGVNRLDGTVHKGEAGGSG
jgi:hypothetical protein